jgi:CRISPR/Cas system-associated exonuclease Cas4 (RecB family)
VTVQLELWQLITLLIAFLGFVAGAFKLLLTQIDKRLDGRFEAMETSRAESQARWAEKFEEIAASNRREEVEWKRIERDFLKFQADLPVRFVMREDYIRGQSVIEAKLDALASKLEVVQLQGAKK